MDRVTAGTLIAQGRAGGIQSYRADIDGLRAIAVLGVVLFHARLGILPGGYVGVDVFFVISGFLITSIIISHQGSLWSFVAKFYERRIRRLIPPTIPVIVFTAVYAWVLLPPAAFEEFARSLVAYTIFASNWFFLSIAGYFDGPSHLKPLLHTWSLSVEEQFYLLFPIPLILLMRRSERAVRILLCIVFAASLAYSVYLVQTNAADAAFFNSLARFWEIAVGGILAVGVIDPPRNERLRRWLGILGLVAIGASMAVFTEATRFPGLSALIPTFGAAAVILSARGPAATILSSGPMVGIGLISYSLYLWHWPLFVFIEFSVLDAGPVHYLGAIAASIALATGSFFLIEKPVRTRKAFRSSLSIGGAFVTSSIMVVALGGAVWATGGAPDRFPEASRYLTNLNDALQHQAFERLRHECWVGDEDIKDVISRCTAPGQPSTNRILLAGDSHAAQYYPAIKETAGARPVNLIAVDSCTLRPDARPNCAQLVKWLTDRAPATPLPYDQVILTARIDDISAAEIFVDTVNATAKHASVTVLGPIQYYDPGLPTLYPTLIGRVSDVEIARQFSEAVQPVQFEIDAILRERFAGTPVNYISMLDLTCPTGPQSCRHFDSDGLPITIDSTHLTLTGARDIINEIDGKLWVITP